MSNGGATYALGVVITALILLVGTAVRFAVLRHRGKPAFGIGGPFTDASDYAFVLVIGTLAIGLAAGIWPLTLLLAVCASLWSLLVLVIRVVLQWVDSRHNQRVAEQLKELNDLVDSLSTLCANPQLPADERTILQEARQFTRNEHVRLSRTVRSFESLGG